MTQKVHAPKSFNRSNFGILWTPGPWTHLEMYILFRQILHTETRVGELKCVSAAKSLAALNPDTEVQISGLQADLTRSY